MTDSDRYFHRPIPLPALLGLLLALSLLLAGLAAEPAQAGLKGDTKRKTKRALIERNLEPVQLRCRLVGKNGSDGARCRWIAAERQGKKVFRCRGEGSLASKNARFRFNREGCKKDKGGTGLTAQAPKRLAKKGYEATDVYCWGLMSGGFKCKFKARRYTSRTFKCNGTATFRNGNFKIRKRRCRLDAAATRAQRTVRDRIRDRNLQPQRVRCRYRGGNWRCNWKAARKSGGWSYRCKGTAVGAKAGGPFDLGRCRLRAPHRAPLGKANKGLSFGVNDSWGAMLGQVRRARKMGSNTLRAILNWGRVEQQRGSYDWSFYDRMYKRMLSRKIRPLFVVMAAPCWAAGGSCGAIPAPPTRAHEGAWRNFVAAAARRYPKARGIEVWNEPNFSGFFAGGVDPERYARLLQLARQGVESANGNLPVISGGLAAFNRKRKGKMRYDAFLRRVFKAGGGKGIDAIGHHAFSGKRLRDGYANGLRIQIADLKDVAIDFGKQNLPIWITEAGTSSAKPSVGRKEQARTNVKGYRTLRRVPGIRALIFHRWRDQRGGGNESGYGLTTRGLKAKPALCALAKARGRNCPR